MSSSNWRDEILDFASCEALPTKWNTEKVDHFRAIMDVPLPFEETEFHTNLDVSLPDGVEKLRLVAGKTLLLSNELKAGDVLQWWISGDAEFGLGIYYTKNKDEKSIEK